MLQGSGHSRGSVLIVVMVFTIIFGVLAAGYLSATATNVEGARLQAESQRAYVAAESGLGWARTALPAVILPPVPAEPAETLQAVADALNATLGAGDFGGAQATVDGATLTCPSVVLGMPGGEATFTMRIASVGDEVYRLESMGTAGDSRATVAMEFEAEPDVRLITDFGLASRSRIVLQGNARVDGANAPSEGSLLSTNQIYMDPVSIIGSVYVSGNVAITNPDGNVKLKGNSEVGGDIMIGVSDPPFPTLDPSIFEPYATNTLDPSISTYSSDMVLSNVRIPAGTNPTFSAGVQINGVVYVESPNVVKFAGHTSVTGVIVAEEPVGTLDVVSNSITFTGDTSSQGVEALPDTAEYAGLRDKTGTFLLTPGYAVEFQGSFTSINGSIAASKVCFTGDATGTVSGSVLNYHDTDMEILGSSHITIDHSNVDDGPAGMNFPRRMVPCAGTYNEIR